ncbi:MAG: cytochrome c oxidase subunit II [Cyanobacteria bacterium]|nr:cytochrome c oxidase subunit II [Cyanobacteriota bacterium]
MPIPAAILTLGLSVVLVLVGLWVGQNVNMLPIDASANAPVYDELFQVLFSIGTSLLLGIVGLLIYSLVRYRRVAGDTGDGLPIEGNLPLEIFWTAVPAIVVLFIGIYSYDIYERMGGMAPLNDHSVHVMQASADSSIAAGMAMEASQGSGGPARIWGGISPTGSGAAAVNVDVTAMQFAFIFRYPESGIISGELHVPVGQTVALNMEAKDVIHAFWVPQFRLKQDVIPGQPTLLSFTATKEGRYPIICAELCGPYHGGMRSTVVVEDPETYSTWVTKNSPAPLPVSVSSAPSAPLQS